MAADGVNVSLLVTTPRLDALFPGLDQALTLVIAINNGFDSRLLEKQVDQLRGQVRTPIDLSIKMVQELSGRMHNRTLTKNLKVIAAILDGDIEALFNLLEMRIKRPTKSGKLLAVIGFQNDLVRGRIRQIHVAMTLGKLGYTVKT